MTDSAPSADQCGDEGAEDGMDHIAGDLAEHHHQRHTRLLKVRDEVQVRGNNREQICPPKPCRREKQRR